MYLPVCLVGRNKAGDVSEDPTSALDDCECVSLTAMGQCSHQKGQSPIHSTDICLVLRTVS